MNETNKEIEIYKKALVLACSEVVMRRICDIHDYPGEYPEDVAEEYLQKAREKE